MEILINGKKHSPAKPKAKQWRELMEFDEIKSEIQFEKYVDSHIEIIVKSFNNPAVTVEALQDNFEVDELITIYRQLITYFCKLLSGKLDKIPNDPAATAAE